MCRSLAALAVALLALAALPATVGARQAADSHPWARALEYDLDAVRQAMSSATADEVGYAPSTEVVEYFADRPLGWSHPQRERYTHAQPDGSTFTAEMLDIDEGGGQVVDGHLITKGEDGWWRYGIRQNTGRVQATGAVVGRDAAPGASSSARMPAEFRANLDRYAKLAEQYRQAIHASNAAAFADVQAAAEPVVFKIPALMLEVNGESFQDGSTPESIGALYDGIGTNPTGTVTEMYLEQSFGNMVIEIDVYGTYTSPLSEVAALDGDCWYGTDGGPILGRGIVLGDTVVFDGLGLGGYGAKGMAIEAVPQADLDVDFSQYDQNGDGYVDFLMIVHSGPGAESTGNPCDVHSHYFNGLGPAFGLPPEPTPLSVDGVAIGAVLTVPELDASIGVVAHEIMHALGEPDYYGTSGTSGTGDWDLGAGGSWLGIPTQTNPIHFNPVMKMNFGWVDPVIVEDTTTDLTLRPRAAHPDLALVPLVVAPPGSDDVALCEADPIGLGLPQNEQFKTPDGGCIVEGFLLENVSSVAGIGDRDTCTFTPMDFDRQMYGSGLMVWHFDFTSYVQLGNNNTLRPMLDIEEFDRRDSLQEMETDLTRGEPSDPFWGDVVGMSSATADLPATDVEIPSPPGSPYSVAAPAPGTSDTTDSWTVPDDVPQGTSMIVTLSWATEAIDDWDLYVDQDIGGEWVEVGGDGRPPASGPEMVTLTVSGGEVFRARTDNFASVSPTAEVTVEFSAGLGLQKFGTANTWNADTEPTGWQFTNLRPNGLSGVLGNETRLPGQVITLDAILHDDSTVDVSGDFIRPADPSKPIIAGEPTSFETVIYEHGGAPAAAELQVWAGDPSAGGSLVASFDESLEGYEKRVLEFTHSPELGANELWVTTSVASDLVPENDSVRTTFEAYSDDADILVVANDRGWTQEEGLAAVLESLGVRHHVIHTEATQALMEQYDGTIWLTSAVSGGAGVMSEDAFNAIDAYLGDGGNLWLASARAVTYINAQGGAGVLARWFGIEAQNNILNGYGTVQGLGGPVGGDRLLEVIYNDGRAYLDFASLAGEGAAAEPAGTVTPLWQFAGRETFDVDDADIDVYFGTMVQAADSTAVWSFPVGNFADGGDAREVVGEVLDLFDVPTGAAPAQDAIRMNRFQHVQPKQDWPVTVGATSTDGIQSVTLHHRTYGDGTWHEVELSEAADGLWTGTIPGARIFNNGIEYYAEAVTGDGSILATADKSLPDVASAPYGDPMPDADFCAAVADTDDDGRGPIPATGGGLALVGLLVAGAAGLRRRRAA